MPPQQDLSARSPRDHVSQSRQSPRNTENMTRSACVPQRLRNDESWVEISSQPSSSSLSSIGDEIVTTGLHVAHDANMRRRRRVQGAPSQPSLAARQTSTSSQEEYEESESEEDHVLSSSNENIPPVHISRSQQYNASSSEDENATALGKRTEPAFTPQPNAFSHPPASQRPVPGSYFPNSHPRPSNIRSRTQPSYNQADHDAALRASLTTLLSIGAAAARGLPKRDTPASRQNEPMTLRLIPESELLGPSPPAANSSRHLSSSTRAPSTSSTSPSPSNIETSKRRAPAGASPKARAAKKKKVQLVDEALLSPTLLTWVMSAGVVVLVSVVGFGAGYVIGREVGRQEALAGFNGSLIPADGSCGREVARSSGGLRKWRWGAVRSVVA